MSDQPPDPLEALRQRLGITDGSAAKVRAGAVAPATWEERQAEYAAEMKLLAEAGSDHSGIEEWRAVMRRLGRTR